MTRDLPELVAQHRSGFAADVVSDVAPLDVSRFPPSVLDDSCAPEGMVDRIAYAQGQSAADARWFRRWVYPAMAAAAVVAGAVSAMWPSGFQALIP